MGWLALAGAIASEGAATLSLRGLTDGWRWGLGLVVIAGYGVSFVLLAIALRTVPLSTAYAVWSGLGTVGIAVLATLLFREHIPPAGIVGIGLVIVGVVILNLSGTSHG